jgi:uncharacterized protein YkwD
MASPNANTTAANRNTWFRFCFAYLHLSGRAWIKVLPLALCVLFTIATRAQQSPQEKQLFEQLNQSRREANLPTLEWDERLAQAARQHTKLMIDNNQLGHVLKGEPSVAERLAATGVRFNRSGENVGYNTDFEDLHRAWMASPGHRENILNPNYTVVGIGVAQNEDGLYYATQDFAHALPQRSAEQAEDMVADRFDELRKKAGHGPLPRVKNTSLHDIACEMANSGKLDPRAPSRFPGVRASVVFNNSRPDELPKSAQDIAHQNRFEKFAVGACFTTDRPDNPGGTYYVVMAFY